MPEETQELNRCRLILVIVPTKGDFQDQAASLEEAMASGDVASVIFSPGHFVQQEKSADIEYLNWCKTMVPIAQAHGAAALCVSDTQALGRSGADGLIAYFGKDDAKELVARFSPQKLVGLMNIKDRHRALEAGDLQPDFVFFGAPEGDIKPDPHPKNLALGEWWSQMVEIPCVVMGGTDIESAVDVAKTGADFVAMGLGVFSYPQGAGAAVKQINELLDEHAPEFEIE